MLPLAGTRERAELEAEAHGVALQMLDREFMEISTALHKTYLCLRAKFLTERKVLDAENEREAWHECVVDARQLVAQINDLWALRIRHDFAATSTVV